MRGPERLAAPRMPADIIRRKTEGGGAEARAREPPRQSTHSTNTQKKNNPFESLSKAFRKPFESLSIAFRNLFDPSD